MGGRRAASATARSRSRAASARRRRGSYRRSTGSRRAGSRPPSTSTAPTACSPPRGGCGSSRWSTPCRGPRCARRSRGCGGPSSGTRRPSRSRWRCGLPRRTTSRCPRRPAATSAYLAVHVHRGEPHEAYFGAVEAVLRDLDRAPALGQAAHPHGRGPAAHLPRVRRVRRPARPARPRAPVRQRLPGAACWDDHLGPADPGAARRRRRAGAPTSPTWPAAYPGPRLRPHVKAHKTTALARRQAAAGHTGFTCATVREVEGMAAAGLGAGPAAGQRGARRPAARRAGGGRGPRHRGDRLGGDSRRRRRGRGAGGARRRQRGPAPVRDRARRSRAAGRQGPRRPGSPYAA